MDSASNHNLGPWLFTLMLRAFMPDKSPPNNYPAGKSPMESTILLLISEPLVRLVIQEFLERAGYLVMGTGDLGTAVQRIGEASPDLLIISPYVETISGHQAAKYLQSRCLTMRILMVAGLLADDRLQYRAELERVEIFPQPFTGDQLLDKVRAVLSESLRVGQ
jgi:DNA-binding response OmpR family regulator